MQKIKEVGPKGLREFGIVAGGLVAALFGLLLPWLGDSKLPVWPWVLAGALMFWALIAPAGLRPVYRGWMRMGQLIGAVTTPLILSVVFFLLILPVGIIMRLLRYDPLARNMDQAAPTYRVPSRRPAAKEMERPF